MLANDRAQIEALQETVARQNDRITELEHGGGGGSGEVAKLQDQVSKLQAQLAAAQSQPSPSPGEGAAGASSSPGPDLASASTPGAMPTPAPVRAAPPPTWQAAATQELGSTQNDPGAKLYRTGLAEMKAGKYQSALVKFQELQRRYPKSSRSEPAEYFSANALYELGQYEKSILQFNDVTMRFPEGRYASASLLREAQAFMKINDQIDARLTLQKLLNDHPSAAEAPMAKSMMDSLSS
jgi:tol-pal system protein YbgF